VYCSLAEVSARNNYVEPEVDISGFIDIKDGRHPVVENMQDEMLFVPNDTYLNEKESRTAIITGPNMAGKSTYMRQTALIVLMAQIGSFVPAKSARIGIVDRVFTRIGASDDLSGGKSTFMVEMTEVADILSNATKSSLLILDEIGRGTSTYDGMSVARAVLECCNDKRKLGAKTMFATHYHELTVLEDEIEGIKNYNISAKKRGDEIIFLRKIVSGGTDDSYGIEVAGLAGLPETVIKRAKAVLKTLEEQGNTGGRFFCVRSEETGVSENRKPNIKEPPPCVLSAAACFADLSTGEIFITEFEANDLKSIENELSSYMPSEVILGGNKELTDKLAEYISTQFGSLTQYDNSRFTGTQGTQGDGSSVLTQGDDSTQGDGSSVLMQGDDSTQGGGSSVSSIFSQ
jgi:DNA mismatch repair ATPase MutS